MLIRLLEKFFPPKPGRVDPALRTQYDEVDEQGWAGNVREKKYRDGIDRVRKEGL